MGRYINPNLLHTRIHIVIVFLWEWYYAGLNPSYLKSTPINLFVYMYEAVVVWVTVSGRSAKILPHPCLNQSHHITINYWEEGWFFKGLIVLFHPLWYSVLTSACVRVCVSEVRAISGCSSLHLHSRLTNTYVISSYNHQ